MVDDRNHGSTVVITGASSGIGRAAARQLARLGWNVIGLGRNRSRIEQARAEIAEAAAPGVRIDMVQVDLAVMDEAARAALAVADLAPCIDALVNNAGGAAKEQAVTVDGNEETFASNHLGPFLFTALLLPSLKGAATDAKPGNVRIVNTSSAAHRIATGFDWNDVQSMGEFRSMAAYANAKLANIYFTRSLAWRLAGDGIVVHALHPGAVDTNFIDRADETTQKHMRSSVLMSAEEAAETITWLVTDDEAGRSSGGYFYQCAPLDPTDLAQDASAAERLWEFSAKLVAPWLDGSKHSS